MKKELEEKYGNYIENIKYYKKDKLIDPLLKGDFLKLHNTENLKDREELWEKFTVNINHVKQIPAFANPYFLGFGNPDSDILFIGKEKAFDIYRSPMSFFHESFNNTLQWKLIAENKFDENSAFDPRNPRKFHFKKIKSIHTWGKYAQIIAGIKTSDYPKDMKELYLKELLAEYKPEQNSLFDHCFMTEINHLPSRYSIGHSLTDERKSLLKDPFYKRFKNVVIGAKGYLENSEIEEIFDVSYKRVEELGRKGRNKDKVIEATIFSSDKQQVIYCQQLSGASGWTNEAIDNLVSLLK